MTEGNDSLVFASEKLFYVMNLRLKTEICSGTYDEIGWQCTIFSQVLSHNSSIVKAEKPICEFWKLFGKPNRGEILRSDLLVSVSVGTRSKWTKMPRAVLGRFLEIDLMSHEQSSSYSHVMTPDQWPSTKKSTSRIYGNKPTKVLLLNAIPYKNYVSVTTWNYFETNLPKRNERFASLRCHSKCQAERHISFLLE